MNDKLIVKCLKCTRLIHFDEILFCKAEKSYCQLFLVDDSTQLVSRNLKSVFSDLDQRFIRISKSFVVNCRYVKRIDKKTKFLCLNNESLLKFTVKVSDMEKLLVEVLKDFGSNKSSTN